MPPAPGRRSPRRWSSRRWCTSSERRRVTPGQSSARSRRPVRRRRYERRPRRLGRPGPKATRTARLVGRSGRPPSGASSGGPPPGDRRDGCRPARARRVKIAADPPRRGTRLSARRDGWPRRGAHLSGRRPGVGLTTVSSAPSGRVALTAKPAPPATTGHPDPAGTAKGVPRRGGGGLQPQLRHVARQDLLQRPELRPAGQRLADVPQRRRDGRQEPGVAAHAVDEDEAAGVLELPLHGEQVEGGPEGGGVEPGAALRLEPRQVARQHALHQLGRQLHVAVAEQRHQVVLARRQQGVLEVDDGLRATGQDHEVARLVVTVGEPCRLGGQGGGHVVEGAVHLRPLGGREGGSLPGLEQPLPEVIELPPVERPVEAAPEGHAGGVRGPLGPGPQERQLVHRPLVERPGRVAGQEPRLQHLVAQVLEDHEPLALEEGVDGRHPHPHPGKVALHVDERVLGRRPAAGGLLGPGVHGHHHHHPGVRGQAHPPVAPHRGVPGQPAHRPRRGVPPRRPGDRPAHPRSHLLDAFRHHPLLPAGPPARRVDTPSGRVL